MGTRGGETQDTERQSLTNTLAVLDLQCILAYIFQTNLCSKQLFWPLMSK